MGPVIGVVGGCGGIGASRFAAVLAALAASIAGRALLADLDPCGGGVDVLVGAEAAPGPRWSQLRLAGGVLDPEVLLRGLPTWGATSLLACDLPALPGPEAVAQVLDAARSLVPVIIDLSRWPSPAREAALARCAVVALIVSTDIGGVTAARAVRAGLGERPVAIVGRGSRARVAQAATLIGAPLAARLPGRPGRAGAVLDPRGLPRPMRRVAHGLLSAVAAPPDACGWVPELEFAR
jgi:hypothetical protein